MILCILPTSRHHVNRRRATHETMMDKKYYDDSNSIQVHDTVNTISLV